MSLEEEAIKMVIGGRLSVSANRLIELHKALIGGIPDKWYCSTCSGKLNMIFTDLKLKYFQKTNTTMAKSTKYRASKAARDNGAKTVVLMNDGRTEVINLDNMTDAQAERILKSSYKHNIEKVETKEESEPKAAAKTAPKTSK